MAERSQEEIWAAVDRMYRRQAAWRIFWFLILAGGLVALWFWWVLL